MTSQNPRTSVSLVEKRFQESLKKFKTRLTKEEHQKFNLTTSKDLELAIFQIQSDQAARFKAQNLARLRVFLDGFNQFGQIAEVFLNVSPFVAFVWGPMKLILQTANNLSDALDTVLDAYEQIGEVLPLVKGLHAVFAENDRMQEALGRIYEDILEFHRRALRFFTHQTWQLVFRSVWTTFKSRFSHILEDLQRHKDLIESQASLLQFEQYQIDRKKIHAQFKDLEIAEQKRRYTEIFRWASVADSVQDHEDVCQVRKDFPDSGTWLLQHNNYSTWRKDSLPNKLVFWLNGIPGAGKTVLASMIVEDCKQDTSARTIYFYCKHGDPQKTTCASVLKSLLIQLVSHDHHLLPWIYEQYLTRGQVSLKSVDLCRKLLETVLIVEKKVYLIVDGLDECEPKEAKALLYTMKDFISVCNLQDHGKLRVSIISQDWPHIRESLASYYEFPMKALDNEKDIRRYAEVWSKKVMEKFELPIEDKEYLCNLSCERANGMFLFVELVMKNLHNQINIEQLRKQIEPTKFPSGLNQAYDRIIERIRERPPEEQSLGQMLLGWMTCAKRPLKWHEIQGATAIDLEENDVRFMERRSCVHVHEICGSLVTKLPGDRLELVHTTAKHYLTHTKFIQPSIIECHLAALCLKYVTFDCFDAGLSEHKLREYLDNGYFAFQDYAVTHWADHLNTIVKIGPATSLEASQEAAELLSSAVTDFVAQFQLHQEGDDQAEEVFKRCTPFRHLSFHDDLQCIIGFIQQQKALGMKALDQISPKGLQDAVFANRAVLENLSSNVTGVPELQKNLVTFYGTNWFKCSRASCFYFHEGFIDKRSSEAHDLRHEKPFRCVYQECETGYRLGFTTAKDLEKHTLMHHPELRSAKPTFSKLEKPKSNKNTQTQSSNRTKHAATFACDLCPKTFTRSNILKSHRLTHQNEKPFVCNHCSMSFVRDNDRKRHQLLHVSEKKFICGGTYGTPPTTWGCGKDFVRQDALSNHHKSAIGKACIASRLEAQQQQEQSELQLGREAADGSNIGSSQSVLERYAGLKNAQWTELIMDQKFGKPVFDIATVLGAPAEFCVYTQVTDKFVDLTWLELSEQDQREIVAQQKSQSTRKADEDGRQTSQDDNTWTENLLRPFLPHQITFEP